jgi:hypothetical protein
MTTFRCQSTGVIHRARIDDRGQRAETACGQRIDFTDPGLDPDGEWTDEYCQWLARQTKQTQVLCSHCRDREPAWNRRRRLTLLRSRRRGRR